MSDERKYYNDNYNEFVPSDSENVKQENIPQNTKPVNDENNIYSNTEATQYAKPVSNQPVQPQYGYQAVDSANVYSSTKFVGHDNESSGEYSQNNLNSNINDANEYVGQGYQAQQPQYGQEYTSQINRYSQTPYGTAPQQPQKPKKRKGKGGIAVALACCMIVSTGLGFGGGWLASTLNGKDSGVAIQRVVNNVNTASATESADLSITEIANLTDNSVVEITTESVTTGNFNQQYISSGAGSGVIITKDGYIVTNNHVIDGASTIKVTLRDGTSYDATLVGTDPTLDVAVIKVDATDLSPALTGDSDKLQVGDKAVAIGNPLGQLGGTVTDGIISALNRDVDIDGNTMNLLQTNAAINPGNSGGGLFNGKGELIGIVVAKSSGSEIEGLGFAIPINNALDAITDLIDYGYVTGRVDAGLSLVDVSNQQTAMMYGLNETGVYIQSVTQGSAAADAGLKSGQRITKVDGTEVSSSADVKSLIQKHSVGETVEITTADGTTAKLTLKEQKPTTSTNNQASNNQNQDGNQNGNQYGNNQGGNSIQDYFENIF